MDAPRSADKCCRKLLIHLSANAGSGPRCSLASDFEDSPAVSLRTEFITSYSCLSDSFSPSSDFGLWVPAPEFPFKGGALDFGLPLGLSDSFSPSSGFGLWVPVPELPFEGGTLDFGLPLGSFGARGANSKPTFPPSPTTRNAENGRPFFEINLGSKSVLPVVSSFTICARSISRCKMILPERKVQLAFSPAAFSQI